METNVTEKGKIPEGSITHRRLAMEAMVEAGKAMLKAHAEGGFLALPEQYNLVASQVQAFVEWRESLGFKSGSRTLEELI